jgi:hypothetical protein
VSSSGDCGKPSGGCSKQCSGTRRESQNYRTATCPIDISFRLSRDFSYTPISISRRNSCREGYEANELRTVIGAHTFVTRYR